MFLYCWKSVTTRGCWKFVGSTHFPKSGQNDQAYTKYLRGGVEGFFAQAQNFLAPPCMAHWHFTTLSEEIRDTHVTPWTTGVAWISNS